MDKEILRLFKGYLIKHEGQTNLCNFSEKALKYGILINVNTEYGIIEEAIKQYGKDGEKWNQTFHKDFEIVRNAPIEDLIQQQLIHYMTTYGFESLGIYDQDTVYIPKEKLEIPELDKDIEMIVIHPMTKQELTTRLMDLLISGIALSEQTVKDIMILSNFIDKDRFDEIKNREIKTALYDQYNIMPRNPEDFLRYLLFKLTNNTLKIQNVEMINNIKKSDKELALKMLKSYLQNTHNGYAKLSSIFLRNKNLFLALKIDKNDTKLISIRKELNAIINKLRKYAVKNHKPLHINILDALTNNNNIDLPSIEGELDNVTIFREIRILNGVLYRLNGGNSIVYKVRNGKSYVKSLDIKSSDYLNKLSKVADIIKKHLIERLKKQVSGKTIYIPKNVTYAAPTSEKQFNGNFPEGSYIEVERNDALVYGIHWKNITNGKNVSRNSFYGEVKANGEERVDLDLKQMNKSEVFGWDASYRSSSSDILFSGDVTDAQLPKGATELFYVGQNYGHGAFLITLNMFTDNSEDVPFEFVIAKANSRDAHTRKNYVIDPNNILEKIDMTIKNTERQMVVGFITIGDTIRFYFNDFSAGSNVKTPRGCSTSTRNEITMGAFDYLQAYSKTQLKLNDLLKDAGAIISDKPTIATRYVIVDSEGNETIENKEVSVDIDLSTNNISKDTVISLLNESGK